MENVDIALKLREAKKFIDEAEKAASAVDHVGDAADETGRSSARAERSTSRFRSGLLLLGTAAGAAGTAMLLGTKQSIDAAVNLGEQINKTKVVFRGSEQGILRWSKTTASGLGISRREALEAAGVFGNMLVPMGFARGKAADMSKSMVNLAADMASFNNAEPTEVLEALRSGLSGETEPLRKFGVFLNEDRLQAEALALGLKKGKGPLTAQQKAMATYSLILKDTKDAHGDFANTSGSLANQQRIFKAQMENLKATLGKGLLPILSKGATLLTNFLQGMQNGTGIGGQVAGAFRSVSHAIGGFFSSAGSGQARLAGLRATLADLATVFRVSLNAVRGAAQVVLPGIIQMFRGMATTIQGIIKVIASIMRGDFRGAWQGVKLIFRGAISGIIGIFRAFTAPLRNAAGKLFGGIKDAFRGAINFVIRGWNSLEFKMPSVNTHIPGVGKVGGFTVGVPDIPLLALGGTFASSGAAIVGDNGPELLTAAPPATVTPLNNSDGPIDLSHLGGTRSIRIPVHLDGRVISEVVVDNLDAQAARA